MVNGYGISSCSACAFHVEQSNQYVRRYASTHCALSLPFSPYEFQMKIERSENALRVRNVRSVLFCFCRFPAVLFPFILSFVPYRSSTAPYERQCMKIDEHFSEALTRKYKLK